jgi:nucleotide-binding universal stress UspA family protein
MPVPQLVTPDAAISEHPVVACYRGLDSLDAVQLGAQLATALDEPLVIATAYDYEPVTLSARALPPADNERRAQAARAGLERARGIVGTDVDVREQVIPAAGIESALSGLARDVGARMMVVGRDTEGHVTRSLFPRAPCPVAVAPLSVALPAPEPFARIGVAYDGSPQAHWALVAATELARATGARLVLLSVAATKARAQTRLDVARLLLDRAVQAFETQAIAGDPAAALASASAGVDLLVCGSRGRGRALSAILGSVSAHLVDHAECAVLVVPPVTWRRADRPRAAAV